MTSVPRASRAFTADPDDAWTSAFGPQEQQWLQVTSEPTVTTDHVNFEIGADARHSTPIQVTVTADDQKVATVPIDVPDAARGGDRTTWVPQTVSFPATTAHVIRITIDASVAPPGPPPPAVTIPPTSIRGVAVPGLPPAPHTGALPGDCVGTLRVDGTNVRYRLGGDLADARRGLTLESCDGPVRLTQGSHLVRSLPGSDTGLDVDRVVLTSGPTGTASVPGPLVAVGTTTSPVRVDTSSPTETTVHTRSDGRPFWLVLGQSHSDGWRATVGGHDLGAPSLVDGYANAWLVRPGHAGTVTVHLSWTPQRVVWIALGISGVAIAICVAIVVLFARRRRRAPARRPPRGTSDRRRPAGAVVVAEAGRCARRRTDGGGGRGVLRGRGVREPLARGRRRRRRRARRGPRAPPRPALGLVAGVGLVIARTSHTPERAWYAVALFAVTVLTSVLGAGVSRATGAPAEAGSAPDAA